MELEDVRRHIVSECFGEDGFLAALHSCGSFDDARFKRLVADIGSYAELLGDSDVMHRDVGACLCDLLSEVMMSLAVFDEQSHPDQARLQAAHEELANQIYWVFRYPPE